MSPPGDGERDPREETEEQEAAGEARGGADRREETEEQEVAGEAPDRGGLGEDDLDDGGFDEEGFDEEDFDEEGLEEELDDDLDEGDFDDDLDEEDLDVDEHSSGEDELEQIVSAETVEWSLEEQGLAEGGGEHGTQAEPEREEEGKEVEEPTLVRPGGPAELSRTSRLRWALGSPFRRLRRLRFPLWARFITASFVIVASVAGATATSLLLFVSDIAADIRPLPGLPEEALPDVEVGEPQTIMVVGSDLRPSDRVAQKQATGRVEFRGLSDTTMLIRLDPNRDAIALFSLPRDLKVEIPGRGVGKLNEAYAYGGPKLTYRTVSNLTGLDIHHVVNIDFEGFARAVNAIDCVYVDVDRRYFNENDPYDGQEDYEEIDIEPGYQALCGYDALDYARYRHTDNDVVRAARQQDFLREARAKVPPERIWAERGELLPIFTEHTSSDIRDWATMLDVLKLFLAARNAPVKEIHFEGNLGPSFVTATDAQIEKAVNEFLGIQDTPGARGKSAKPAGQAAQRQARREARGQAPAEERKSDSIGSLDDAQLVPTTFGKQLAQEVRSQYPRMELPFYYPTLLEEGSDFPQEPRVYKINGFGRGSPSSGERPAYKWVFSSPGLGEYYGFMGTRWKDPPILDHPSETRELGGREYELYYDGDRLRVVAWQDEEGSFWLSNTLIQSLSEREMIEIARAMRRLPFPGR